MSLLNRLDVEKPNFMLCLFFPYGKRKDFAVKKSNIEIRFSATVKARITVRYVTHHRKSIQQKKKDIHDIFRQRHYHHKHLWAH